MDSPTFNSSLPDSPHTEAADQVHTSPDSHQSSVFTPPAQQPLDLNLSSSSSSDNPASPEHQTYSEDSQFHLLLDYHRELSKFHYICRQIKVINLRLSDLLQRHRLAKKTGRLAFKRSLDLRLSTMEGVGTLLNSELNQEINSN